MDFNKEDVTKARGIVEEMMKKDDVPKRSFELEPAFLTLYQLGVYASSIHQREIKISWTL